MKKYSHLTKTFREAEGERPVFRVAFKLERDFYVEADSEEELIEQLNSIDYSSVEEAVWIDGADSIEADIVGDTARSSDFYLEPTDYDTFQLKRC